MDRKKRSNFHVVLIGVSLLAYLFWLFLEERIRKLYAIEREVKEFNAPALAIASNAGAADTGRLACLATRNAQHRRR